MSVIQRVQVIAKTPEPAGSQTVELKLRGLLVSKFSGTKETTFTNVKPVVVNARSLDRVIRDVSPTLRIDVTNVVDGQIGDIIPVDAVLDCRPDDYLQSIIRQTPKLNKVYTAIEGLRLLKSRIQLDRSKELGSEVEALLRAEPAALGQILGQ